MNCRQADKALTNSQKQQELADPDPSPLIGWMHLVPRLKLGFKLIKTMVVIRIRIIIIIFFLLHLETLFALVWSWAWVTAL